MRSSFRVRTAGLVALIAALASVPYLGALRHDFLSWDDNIIILGQPFLRELTLENVCTALSPVPAREEWLPVRDLTLLLNFALLGPDAGAFAAVNIALHAGASVLIFFLLWRLTGSQRAGALGAALFACHAIHVESVAWLSGRKDPLSAIFMVGAMIAHSRWRAGEGRYATTLLLLVLALLSKASTFVFPLWVAAYDLFYLRHLGWRQRLGALLPFAAVALAGISVFLKLISTDGVIEDYPQGGLTSVLLTNFVLFKDYTWNVLCPWRHQAIYEVRFVQSFSDPELLASILLLGAIAWLGWRFRRLPWLPFGLVLFYGSFLPYMNLVPHGIYYAERYLYLPSITLSLFLGLGLEALLARERLPRLVLRGAVAAYAFFLAAHLVLAETRTRVWADSESFWAYQASVLPGNPAPLMNLGEAREAGGRDREAALAYEEVLGRYGTVPEALYRLGRIARRQGQLQAARELYRQHAELAPRDPRPLNNLGEVLLAEGKPDEGLRAYEAAIARAPGYLLARANRANLLERLGRAEEARAEWREILDRVALLPDLPLAEVARAHLESPGKTPGQ